jgi:hypothetical protein
MAPFDEVICPPIKEKLRRGTHGQDPPLILVGAICYPLRIAAIPTMVTLKGGSHI